MDGVALVQSADNTNDTRNTLAQADSAPSVLGVVGWAPLEAPDRAREELVALPAVAVEALDPERLLYGGD